MHKRTCVSLTCIVIGAIHCGGGPLGAENPGIASSNADAVGQVTTLQGLGGMCLDIPDDQQYEGATLQLWDCNGTEAQSWTLQGNAIVSSSGLCVDIPANVQRAGARLQLWECNGTRAQQWSMRNGAIVSTRGLCIAVAARTAAEGESIQLRNCTGSANEQWTTSEAATPPPPTAAPPPAPTAVPPPAPTALLPTPSALQNHTNVLFDDEFDGALDTSRWEPNYWYDIGNGGMASYEASQVETSDGSLRIRTQPSNGSAPTPYLTGIVTTHGSFQFLYGVYEVRMRANVAPGVLSAAWAMTDVSWPPEIDLIETPDDHTAAMTVHFDNGGTPDQSGGYWFNSPDLSADFHTYTVAWTPNSIDWYIDGVQHRDTFTDAAHIPNVPLFLILSTHVGAPGAWQGTPDGTTPMPDDYTIDYVRVWQ